MGGSARVKNNAKWFSEGSAQLEQLSHVHIYIYRSSNIMYNRSMTTIRGEYPVACGLYVHLRSISADISLSLLEVITPTDPLPQPTWDGC